MDTAGHPRIGLIGCGRWGSLILRDLRILGADVHVIVPPRDDPSRILGLGAAAVDHDVTALGPIDGIVVATTTSTHAEVIDSVIDLDVPIFVEKPLTADPQSASRFATLAPDRIFVMEKWRYHPGVIAIRDLVAAGDLGRPVAMNTVRVQNGMPHTDVDCTWILLPHDLSIAFEIFGSFPIARAAIAQRIGDDIVAMTAELEIPVGVAMHVEIGITAPESRRSVEVVGEEFTATLGGGWGDSVVITANDQSQEPRVVAAGGELPLLAELRAFLTFIDGGPPPRSSVGEGASVVRIIGDLRDLAGARS